MLELGGQRVLAFAQQDRCLAPKDTSKTVSARLVPLVAYVSLGRCPTADPIREGLSVLMSEDLAGPITLSYAE